MFFPPYLQDNTSKNSSIIDNLSKFSFDIKVDYYLCPSKGDYLALI